MPHPLTYPRARRPLRAALVGTAATALAVVLGPGTAPAAAVQLGPLTKVSDGDPFAGCTADNVAAQKKTGAILYPASELEPWVAADPSDPGRLIAGWQQDRWSNGGSRGLVAGVSQERREELEGHDPARRLGVRRRPLPALSDPWVSIRARRHRLLHDLVIDVQPNGAQAPNGMLVTRSTDGGLHLGQAGHADPGRQPGPLRRQELDHRRPEGPGASPTRSGTGCRAPWPRRRRGAAVAAGPASPPRPRSTASSWPGST